MNIFFDVDYTLIDGDGALRPGARRVLSTLAEKHEVYLWSGLGPRWEVVEQHQLEELVSGCYDKPLQRYDELLALLGIPVRPDFVVDDHPHLVEHFGGLTVPAYRRADDRDVALEEVLRVVQEKDVGTGPA